MDFTLKKYEPENCKELAMLFYDTVHNINKADYTPQELDVWATGMIDIKKWNESLMNHYSLVAWKDDKIIGFADMAYDGYLDRLYVHKDYQRIGIATALADGLENNVKGRGVNIFTVYASITAKGFFEKRGYKIIRENIVERCNVKIKNYFMKKEIEVD